MTQSQSSSALGLGHFPPGSLFTPDNVLFVFLHVLLVLALVWSLIRTRFGKRLGTAKEFVADPENPTKLLSVFAVLMAIDAVVVSSAGILDGIRSAVLLAGAAALFYLFFVNSWSRLKILYAIWRVQRIWSRRSRRTTSRDGKREP